LWAKAIRLNSASLVFESGLDIQDSGAFRAMKAGMYGFCVPRLYSRVWQAVFSV
jgi:hypothetical protein